MTNEFPAAAGAFAPLGSFVFSKSRIDRYFASFVVAALRAMPMGNAAAMPRRATCKSFATMARAYIGTSGWVYAGWREHLYADTPTKRWLEVASRTFEALEINGSFYTQIKPETYTRWRTETPDDFVFALKGHRFVSHYKRLRECDESIARLRDQA